MWLKLLTRRVIDTKSDSLGHFCSRSGRVSCIKRWRVQFCTIFAAAYFKIRPEYSNSRSKRGETQNF